MKTKVKETVKYQVTLSEEEVAVLEAAMDSYKCLDEREQKDLLGVCDYMWTADIAHDVWSEMDDLRDEMRRAVAQRAARA